MALVVYLSIAVLPTLQSQSPLTAEQISAVQNLVRTTQTRDEELKESLDQLQSELAAAYGEFELDDALVTDLQKKILHNQQQLFENYHVMQVDLRKIVGRERFAMLKRRIDRILKSQTVNNKKAEPDR